MNFAERMFAGLSAVEDGPDFQTVCEAVGTMFQPTEDIAGDTEDGDIGYSVLLDIDRVPPFAFGYLAQFVGVRLHPGLSDDDQREWIRSTAGFARGRPSSIGAAAKATLTGSKKVIIYERDGSAWNHTIITRTTETPDVALTTKAIMSQKPGPDTFNIIQLNEVDYEWVKLNEVDYAAVEADFSTYQDLRIREF